MFNETQLAISEKPIWIIAASRILTIKGVEIEVTGMSSATLKMTTDMARNDSMTKVTRSPHSGGNAKVRTEKDVTTMQGMMILKRKKNGMRRIWM